MVQMSLRNNPLLAALLGTVATGLGHLYLRRWLRALGWLAIMIGASVLFVPESAAAASVTTLGTLSDSSAILPIIFISAASVFNAYLIAKRRLETKESRVTETDGPTKADEAPACPVCGKPIDLELEFCHWCTTELEVVDVSELERLDDDHPDRP